MQRLLLVIDGGGGRSVDAYDSTVAGTRASLPRVSLPFLSCRPVVHELHVDLTSSAKSLARWRDTPAGTAAIVALQQRVEACGGRAFVFVGVLWTDDDGEEHAHECVLHFDTARLAQTLFDPSLRLADDDRL